MDEHERLLVQAIGREDSLAIKLAQAIIATRAGGRELIRRVLGEHSRALAFERAIEQAADGIVPPGGLRSALAREDEAVRRLERALDVVLPGGTAQPILDEDDSAIQDEDGQPILSEGSGGWSDPQP